EIGHRVEPFEAHGLQTPLETEACCIYVVMSRIWVEGQGALERDARPIGEVQGVRPGDILPRSRRFHLLQVDHLIGVERPGGGGQNQPEAERDGEAGQGDSFYHDASFLNRNTDDLSQYSVIRSHSGATETGLKPDDFPLRIEIPTIFPIDHLATHF